MKREARSMLMAATSTKQIILLVDTLERLGLGYHFESEIEEKLKQVYDSVEEEQDDHDLFATALRFRLLRQHQYHVSCNVFEKFVGENKEFKETLGGDAEGILSLYDAAHVRTGEENILEGAVEFTRQQLSRMLPELKSHLKEKVKRALKHPIHRSAPIVEIRFYIPIYENDESRDELLLKLAKLNFNYLQNMYRNELIQLLRAYYEEQKWVMEGEMPSFEEYVKNSVIRSCLPMTFGSLVPGLPSVTKETIDWMLTQPKIFMSSSIILRLLDDLGSHERENREGKLLTIVDCYMKDKGVSKQEALSKFGEIIDSEWKYMNEEWVKSAALPKEMLLQFLNYIRGGEVVYSNSEDGFTNPEKYLAPIMTALLLDPLLI
ncbi:hypothetical protein C2S52_020988 [Perilla frutescens var. hirtella]|nr:hypothetical protein C2S52_020988 [Perilla frutescens var. hirtella]